MTHNSSGLIVGTKLITIHGYFGPSPTGLTNIVHWMYY